MTGEGYATLRTLRALEALAERPHTAPQLADVLAVHPRTTRRLLRVLVEEGWAENGPGEPYRLTAKIVDVARRAEP